MENSGRPIKEGDIFGDFVWRREHQAPVKAKEVASAVCADLVKAGFVAPGAKVTARYDRHAGCTVCPCSPGYVIESDEPARSYRPIATIWIKVQA